jgi:hypothetical protein
VQQEYLIPSPLVSTIRGAEVPGSRDFRTNSGSQLPGCSTKWKQDLRTGGEPLLSGSVFSDQPNRAQREIESSRFETKSRRLSITAFHTPN